MKTIAVQDFLFAGGTLEQLTEKYGIMVKRHPEFPNLVLLKYNSLVSPMGETIPQDCRGLILDENNNWKIICFPYRKFFNYEEEHSAKDLIDIKNCNVYEKLDGSLMTLYWYAGKWRVSSSGTPDAGGNINGGNETFEDLFWTVWNELGYKLPKDTNSCYMFELMTYKNRIVVNHPKNRLVLHGARDINTRSDYYLKEIKPYYTANECGWEHVQTFPMTTWEEVFCLL